MIFLLCSVREKKINLFSLPSDPNAPNGDTTFKMEPKHLGLELLEGKALLARFGSLFNSFNFKTPLSFQCCVDCVCVAIQHTLA